MFVNENVDLAVETDNKRMLNRVASPSIVPHGKEQQCSQFEECKPTVIQSSRLRFRGVITF